MFVETKDGSKWRQIYKVSMFALNHAGRTRPMPCLPFTNHFSAVSRCCCCHTLSPTDPNEYDCLVSWPGDIIRTSTRSWNTVSNLLCYRLLRRLVIICTTSDAWRSSVMSTRKAKTKGRMVCNPQKILVATRLNSFDLLFTSLPSILAYCFHHFAFDAAIFSAA